MPSGGQAVSCSGLAAWKNLGEERERGRFQIHAPPLQSRNCTVHTVAEQFWVYLHYTQLVLVHSQPMRRLIWLLQVFVKSGNFGLFHSDWSASPWISTGSALTVLFGSSKLHGMGIQSWTDLGKLFIKAPKHPNGILKYHERPHCIAFMVERPVKLKNVSLQFSHQ